MEKHASTSKEAAWSERIRGIPCATFVVHCGLELTLLAANPAFYTLIDRSPEELKSRCGDRIGAIFDRASLESLIQLMKNWEHAKKRTVSLKLKLMRDEAPLWVYTAVTCLDTTEDRFLYCTALDVTDWENREQFLNRFVDVSHFALREVSADTFAYDLETGLARIYRATDILPSYMTDAAGDCPNFLEELLASGVVLPDYEETIRSVFAALRTGGKQVCEMQITAGQADVRWVRLSISVEMEQHYAVGMFCDITEQHKTAQSYLTETLLYQNILSEQTAYGELDVTEDRIERMGGLWRLYNEIINKVTYSELIEEFINKVVLPEDRKHYLEVMQRENFIQSFHNGIDRLTCDFRRIVEQNKMVWMRLQVYLARDPLTKHIVALLCIKDVDQIKKLEQRLVVLQEKKGLVTPVLEGAEPFDTFVAEQGDIAYLVDPETYDLLCCNQAMLDRLGLTAEECLGMKCYEAMHRRDSPCPFCGKANWSSDKFFIWKNLNLALEQEFLIKNKLVQWNGREALFALAVDISNNKSVVDSLENGIMESHSILVGVQRISEANTLGEVMMSTLETIGGFFQADAVQIWQKSRLTGMYERSYHWQKRKNNTAVLDEDQTVNDWIVEQSWDRPILIESPETMLCRSYAMYQCMVAHGIRNQRWSQVAEDDEVQGYLCVSNISSNFENVAFMQSFSVFVGSEIKKRGLMDQLRNAANRDALTDLFSRYSFELYVGEFNPDAVDSMGVIIANFDNLTRINTVRGFNAGNFYICQFADMLRTAFPEQHLFRLNGDEFLVILSDVAQGEQERMLRHLEDMVSENEHFSVSFGSTWDDVEKDLAELIEQATAAMKVNKKRHHDAAPSSEDVERRSMLSELVTGLKNREYEVFLQPKVELKDGSIIGAEALIRYRHKEQGIIPPAQFIGVLEKSNLIRYIDLFVFEEVCKYLEKWQSLGISPLPVVSLNFSRMTLQERDILTSVETIMRGYNVPRHNIEIEITESVANMGKSVLYQTAHDLFEAGFSISLDDFGTKYTNLSILADIDFSVLKLDRSLVGKLEHQMAYRVVLKNVIQMCSELAIDVIAEGVETEAQAQILSDLGCLYGQGYLYGKPGTVPDFEERFLKLPQGGTHTAFAQAHG